MYNLRDRGASLNLDYNTDLCEECDSALKQICSNLNLGQGPYKRDIISAAASKRNREKEKLADNRKVLLTITVEIEEGCVEQVQLKEGDSAETVVIQFCQEHGLPDQFVAPFTEHIVSIISEDRTDIMFPSREEIMSNDESSPRRETKQLLPRAGNAESDACMLARRELQKTFARQKTCQAAFQKVDKPPKCCCCCCCGSSLPPRRKTRRRKRGRKTFSDRLMAPTFTSMAKNSPLDHCLKKSIKTRIRPLSEQVKAVCMRLYTEHIGQCHGHKGCRNGVKRTNSLYQQSIARRRRDGLSKKSWWLSRMRGKIAKQYRNYGVMLYAEGLRKQENHIKAVHERAKQVETRELAEVTLMPKISKRSKNMKKSRHHVWCRLQTVDRPKQDKLQELRQEVWETKLMECTFRRQMNQKRRSNGQENFVDCYSNRFEQLFLDAEYRRRRRAECTQWHPEGVTFQPSVNQGLPYGTSMMDDEDMLQRERSVFQRLVDNAAKVMEKKQMKEQLSHRPFDPRTGRELFKPRIGRKPCNRNPVHLPVGEYLHRMNCAYNSKIRRLAARENRIKKERARARYISPRSQRLVERLKDRGFRQIFEFLDTDNDGYVDLTTANFDRLNSDVVDDLKRLMKMPGGREKLAYNRFEDLMLETEEKYHMGQQVHLGLKHRRHNDGVKCTFKFTMDQLSRHLAQERRSFSSHEEWWEIIISEYIANLRKIEKWRKQKLQHEMAECTFKPYLISCVPVGKGCATRGQVAQRYNDAVAQTITHICDNVQQKVQGFALHNQQERYCLQNDRGGSEVMELPETQLTVGRRKKRQDVVSELDDLPKANSSPMGLFLGLMGA